MSDRFKINNIFSRIKSHFVGDSYSSSSGGFLKASFSKKKRKQQDDNNETITTSISNKLFKLGEDLGLSSEEVTKAIELILKATEDIPGNYDISSVILSNNIVHFPEYDKNQFHIPEKFLKEIEKKSPDLYLALTNPLEFMCKYPKTVSIERFKNFTYGEILEFSNKCLEEYEILKNRVNQEKDEIT